MQESVVTIRPVYPWELWSVTNMSYANMMGVDPQFTALANRRALGALSRMFFPVYLLLAGRGRLAIVSGRIAGYAFLHLRRLSGVIFNVSVNKPFRRQGVAKALIHDLEHTLQRRTIPWASLQVDWDNLAARALYEKLSYHPVHPYLWVGASPPGAVVSEATVEALPRRLGYDVYQHFNQIEIAGGESWAADVLQAEYVESPSGGRFWRCYWQQRVVGGAWTSQERDQLTVRLLLHPEYWREPEPTLGILRQLAGTAVAGSRLCVKLGSSAHHAGAADVMRELSFLETEQARILMLKRVLP